MKIKRHIKTGLIALSFALGTGLVFTSCKDDDIIMSPEVDEPDIKGDGLSFLVTLDNMGGAAFMGNNPMEEVENYVDPEKFRILFFNDKDEFLFESKSRWIRKLPTSLDQEYITWKVSVPFFTYGNDDEPIYDWNWKEIKKQLQSGEFKIAILANRPGIDYSPDFHDTNTGSSWFDNSGPYWDASNSTATEGVNRANVKRVFDLHHAQYDPIYEGKGTAGHNLSNFYNFIGSTDERGRFAMGSTASWVNWTNDGATDPNDKSTSPRKLTKSEGANMDDNGWEYRLTRVPDFNYPIPMYGIQRYDPIPFADWEDGTTYDLVQSLEKPVSLLRCVVRIDLLIPATYTVDYVLLFYSNIYSRCDPMNVWDPTDEIWAEDHDPSRCEWKRIQNHGPISTINDPQTADECKPLYQQRLSWLYGSWLSQGWPFPEMPNAKAFIESEKDKYGDYPNVFNSCIQRNTANFVDDVNYFGKDNGYHHYIIYTGERNVLDPSYLYNMGSPSSGNQICEYLSIGLKRPGSTTTGDRYSIIFTDDYSNIDKACYHTTYTYDTKGIPLDRNQTKPGNNMGGTNGSSGIMYYISAQDSRFPKPIPLMRNHVYRITLGGTRADGQISVKGDEFYSKSLNPNKGF